MEPTSATSQIKIECYCLNDFFLLGFNRHSNSSFLKIQLAGEKIIAFMHLFRWKDLIQKNKNSLCWTCILSFPFACLCISFDDDLPYQCFRISKLKITHSISLQKKAQKIFHVSISTPNILGLNYASQFQSIKSTAGLTSSHFHSFIVRAPPVGKV